MTPAASNCSTFAPPPTDPNPTPSLYMHTLWSQVFPHRRVLHDCCCCGRESDGNKIHFTIIIAIYFLFCASPKKNTTALLLDIRAPPRRRASLGRCCGHMFGQVFAAPQHISIQTMPLTSFSAHSFRRWQGRFSNFGGIIYSVPKNASLLSMKSGVG